MINIMYENVLRFILKALVALLLNCKVIDADLVAEGRELVERLDS